MLQVWRIAVLAFICSRIGVASNVAWAQPFDRAPPKLTVMTWNVEWMFDTYAGDNRSRLAKEKTSRDVYWDTKLAGVCQALAAVRPDIVALQEVEGGQTLRQLIDRLRSQHHVTYRDAFIEGRDTFTEQDVGFLYRSGLVSYRRQEQSRTMYESEKYYNLTKHLIAEFRWGDVQRPLTVLNVHLRAREQAEDKRVKQARLARLWMEQPLRDGHDVLVLGDLNSEHRAGVLRGDIEALVSPLSARSVQLVDLLERLPNPSQSTHLILDRQFDRLLASVSLTEDEPGKDWVFEKIEVLPQLAVQGRQDDMQHWDEPLKLGPNELDLSDHAPVVATFVLR